MAEQADKRNEVLTEFNRLAEKHGGQEAFEILKGIIGKSFDEKQSVRNGDTIYLNEEYILAELKKR